MIKEIEKKEKETQSKLILELIYRDKEEIKKSIDEKQTLEELAIHGVGDSYALRLTRLDYKEEMRKAIKRASIANRYINI